MKINILKELMLLAGVIGVVYYRELPQYWNLLMWIPIAIGFKIYYNLK